ncbi:Protein of unknown function [Pseudomonas frederiksbergensis]|jgi:hypothetical protein|uniref:DUF1652 domain-containing protein n=1 Tax=Pseudomonas frederiksbergensis TaxID=104087 RepID=A0A1H5CLQ6_9PSED|nr:MULTISPECIES: DUF1652 domain-containing protein [Pseudomonas]PMU07807.1 DUF1652 domain-containing protein [Pseudomonas sp. FW305-20]PMU18351.1 DUF1652 domain-containing protein [Pseudomonas sp. FW305-122]PMU39599.1 DUF1652 domain-containing protein [Pseudomonas sp. FW305-47B]PMX57138.1 DUF1652 domain-containing protein [Pseudomonas sp. FW305-33]PMX62627.1 DUF1652 domain-containing protein [Pseudomonas sp. FW305-60]
MLSTLELRHLVEQSFLPTRCDCTVDPPATLTVRFYQGTSNQEILTVTGIPIAPLNNGFAIETLISDLRNDLDRVSPVAPRYSANHFEKR